MPDKADEVYGVHMSWIDACQSSDRLTEWESNFVASVKKYLEDKGALSPKQRDILERIYAEKTS